MPRRLTHFCYLWFGLPLSCPYAKRPRLLMTVRHGRPIEARGDVDTSVRPFGPSWRKCGRSRRAGVSAELTALT